MALKPEASVVAGVAVMGMVYGIHTVFHPPVADIQALPAGNADVADTEKKATWLSVGVVSAVSLLAKDPTIFILGSAATIAMALFTKHAVFSDTKTAMSNLGQKATSAVSANDLSEGPQMTTQDYSMFASSEFVSS